MTNLPLRSTRTEQYMDQQAKLIDANSRNAKYHDRGTKELPNLLPGMKVLVRNDQDTSWGPATIKSVREEPLSYMVETSNGACKRRNRKFIKEIPLSAARKLDFKQVHYDDTSMPTAGESTAKDATVTERGPPVPPVPCRRSTRISKAPERYGYN